MVLVFFIVQSENKRLHRTDVAAEDTIFKLYRIAGKRSNMNRIFVPSFFISRCLLFNTLNDLACNNL